MKRFFPLVSGLLLLLVPACGDLVTESDASACNNALDERDYSTALSVCSERKDKAAAYMGLAGYDLINILDSTEKSASAYTAPSAGANLGTDAATSRTILNLLALDPESIPDESTRRTRNHQSKNYLDNASALLHPDLTDLTSDELLLDAFALAFASQLEQVLIFDNGSVSDNVTPTITLGSPVVATCGTTVNTSDADVQSVLAAVDGHLWTAEQNYYNCNVLKEFFEDPSNSAEAATVAGGGATPATVTEALCAPLTSLGGYLTKLVDTTTRLTLSGDSTSTISDTTSELDSALTDLGCQ